MISQWAHRSCAGGGSFEQSGNCLGSIISMGADLNHLFTVAASSLKSVISMSADLSHLFTVTVSSLQALILITYSLSLRHL